MSVHLLNVDPVFLTVSYDVAGGLVVTHDDDDLADYEDGVLVEISENGGTEFRFADFGVGGSAKDVYVFEEDASGGLSAPWSRNSGGAYSARMLFNDAPRNLSLWIAAVADGSSAPSLTTSTAAQQAGAKLIRAKIRKEGELPLP